MNFKDIFFEPDENDKKSKPASGTPSPSVPVTPSTFEDAEPSSIEGSVNPAKTGSTDGSGVDEYIKLFRNAMKSHPANSKGPNYYEFIMALEKMKAKAMDDKTKYESVFAGFDVLGVTPQSLIDSAKQYQGVFATKKADFEAAVNQSVAQNVEAKKTQIQALKNQNKNIDDQMLSLNQQKLANEDSIKKLSTDITKASIKIESNKADFATAFEQINQEIDTNIEKISQYLGNSAS